jgi:flagellar biosynthesis protein FlhA
MVEAVAVERSAVARPGDLVLPAVIIAVVVFMIIPLPTLILDLLLAASVSLGLIIMLVGIYTPRPLEFSTFPTLLLVVTLFRLALNVASTRLVLLHGHEGPAAAGRVIQAFGSFVVGGSYVVGIVIFIILVVINWSVITKGTGRIAEVAARFTLDGLPGKQLAIDAELNSGLITEQEARTRRREIEAEADFYGAMDGASRFVRGDAIAGIVITGVNIIGGMFIGVVQRGVDGATAAANYTILTIGDGLVSQLPALLVSTAAGMIVTRAAAEEDLGSQLTSQLFSSNRVLTLVAGFLVLFALVPGLPFLPFAALAGLVGGIAYLGGETQSAGSRTRSGGTGTAAPPAVVAPERIEALLPLDLMEIEVGYELVPLVETGVAGASRGSPLVERIRGLRRQLALDMGFIVPPIHIRDNLSRKPGEYGILLKGVEIAKGSVQAGSHLAINPGTVTTPIPGTPVREPAFGLEAVWVTEADRDRAQAHGYSVVDPATVIVTHLAEVIRRHAHELLGRQEVQGLLDTLAKTHPKPVEELVPQQMSVGQVQKVLQHLLREGVGIRDMLTIVECLADHAPQTKDVDQLTEHARQALARSITRKFLGQDGTLALMTLAPQAEQGALDAVQRGSEGTYLALEPTHAKRLVLELGKSMERFAAQGRQPVLLCSAALRPHLRRLLERYLPTLTVLSPAEIPAGVRVQSMGTVTAE